MFSFKYLGHVPTTSDNDWPVVVGKIHKYQKKWVNMSWILGREGGGGGVQVIVNFSKVSVQEVILFGSDMWVITPCMDQALGGVQHRVARQLIINHPQWIHGGSW